LEHPAGIGCSEPTRVFCDFDQNHAALAALPLARLSGWYFPQTPVSQQRPYPDVSPLLPSYPGSKPSDGQPRTRNT